MPLECAGCRQTITNRQYLTCKLCVSAYDIECANVSIQRFLNTMTPEHKEAWKCPTCCSKIPRFHDTNTPVQSRDPPMQPLDKQHKQVTTCKQNINDNITIRNKKVLVYEKDESISEEDLSLLGDTINTIPQTQNKESTPLKSIRSQITLTQIEALLDRKLNTVKHSLLSEITTAISTVTATEIEKLKIDLLKTINVLSSEQENQKKGIQIIENKIKQLDTENLRLQTEIQNLQKNIEKLNLTALQPKEPKVKESNEKKIILYGLDELREEDSCQLYERLVYAFQDILNINVQGYIEGLRRLGKNGHRRPLEIEFLSKNLTRQILQNRRYFRNTGLAVSEVLGAESIQHRKKQIAILIEARRNGHRANIVNTKLYIDGKEYKPDIENPNSNRENMSSKNESYNNSQEERSQRQSQHSFRHF